MPATAEQTLYSANPSMFRDNPIGFVLCLVLSVVGLGLILLLVWWLRCKNESLTVTTHRTILRRGILAKYTSEVFHQDVRNLQVSQGFFQRILGVGNIGISSAGQADVEIQAVGIPDPERVRDLIDQYRIDH
jgi:uncharacterized membrane protein YdbT with pleckstrin-like domain